MFGTSGAFKWAVGLLLAAQACAAFAVTGVRFISTPGDYIGQGQTVTYEAPSATVTASGAAGTVTVAVTEVDHWWYLSFAAPVGTPLARGGYPDAARYPFNSPMGAGLSVSGDGRGCNTLKGWFKVYEYEVDANGVVSKLAIDFLQNCEVTNPPLYGSVRVNSDRPLVVPALQSIAGADFAVIAGQAAALDGSQSFSRRPGALSYLWTQLDGPAVTLSSAAVVKPTFTAPAVGAGGSTLHFRLDVTDRAERAVASDDVVVVVQSATAPRTQISFHGDPGDYITGGRSYSYDLYNAVIAYSRNNGGVSASVNGATWWTLDTVAPSGAPFTTGTYPNAQRFPFQPPDAPGLSLSGDGRGCNTLTGNFTVHQVQFDNSGNPQLLDVTFEQHCEGGVPAAYGQMLLNAVPHTTLAPQLRAARQRYGPRE